MSAQFHIRSINDELREIRGIATTPTPDRYGDVVLPRGAVYSLPLPLLWMHDASKPVGTVNQAFVSDDGIEVITRVERPSNAGVLADRCAEAWESVRSGLVRGFSIGFSALPNGFDIDPVTFAMVFRRWEWLELSLVTIPANAEALITTYRSGAPTKPRSLHHYSGTLV